MKTMELFDGTTSPAEAAAKLETFKGLLDDSAREQQARARAGISWAPHSERAGGWIVPEATKTSQAFDEIAKALGADVVESLRAQLDASDINKDISLTSPLSTGLIPYDLEAPAKFLAPVQTPLRNRIPRIKGQGTTRRYKRITGISGSGTGGVANLSPFINDSSTISAGSLTLRRGPKISYAADDRTATYKQMGLSDLVTWSAEFAGLGFTDPRQLSQTALLMASMLADERILLAGRGTDAGVYVGAMATPSTANVTLTVRTAGTSPAEVGNSANITTLYVRVAGEGMFGESIASAEVTTGGLSAVTGKVVDVTMSGAFVNATGFKIYVGTATGLANQFFAGRTGCWGGTSGQGTAAFTIQFTGGGTGGCINSGANGLAAESASTADGFDGIQTTQLDPTQSGAIYSVGGKLSTTSIGAELQNVFSALYNGVAPGNGFTGVNAAVGAQGVKANPDIVWAAGQDRKQLSATFLGGGSGNPTFFMNVPQTDSANMRMGQVVTGILNETTGKEVSLAVHPYLAQGTMLVLSESLPIPDSQVPAPFAYALPQDYLAINWPVIQHTYDLGSYWFGALINYAPSFSGAVTNILAA